MRTLPLLALAGCIEMPLPSVEVRPDMDEGPDGCLVISSNRADLTPEAPSASLELLDTCGQEYQVQVVLDDPNDAFVVDQGLVDVSEVGAVVVVSLGDPGPGVWEGQLVVTSVTGDRMASAQLAATVP